MGFDGVGQPLTLSALIAQLIQVGLLSAPAKPGLNSRRLLVKPSILQIVCVYFP